MSPYIHPIVLWRKRNFECGSLLRFKGGGLPRTRCSAVFLDESEPHCRQAITAPNRFTAICVIRFRPFRTRGIAGVVGATEIRTGTVPTFLQVFLSSSNSL